MAIFHCTNPFAGKEQGYDPNKYSHNSELNALHVAESHEESWTGCVLALGEHNYYDDSDFYALVWDEEKGNVHEVQYATTRGWTYHNTAKVDATPEVIEKATVWQTGVLFEIYVEKHRAELRKRLEQIEIGTHVRSLTTRGKNKGIEGTVETIGNSFYGPGLCVGIHVEGEPKRRFLEMDRVQRTDLPEDMDAATEPSAEDLEGLRRHAAYNAGVSLKH
jgi:hypothetical protein